MEFFTPRKLKFKAWNNETNLMMRLNNIECIKGELVKKNHILLQFTGLYDKQEEEIYEMDIVMIGSEKFLVVWDVNRNGWNLSVIQNQESTQPFITSVAQKTVRLCSYFESENTVT